MTGQFSDDEARAIFERQQLLDDAATDTTPTPVHEPTREELLQEALSQPVEDRLTKWRREHAEADARRAAARAKTAAAEAPPPQPATMTREQQAPWDQWCEGIVKNYGSELLSVIAEEFVNIDECKEAFKKRDDRIAALEAEVKALSAKQTLELSAEPIDLPALQLRGRMQ